MKNAHALSVKFQELIEESLLSVFKHRLETLRREAPGEFRRSPEPLSQLPEPRPQGQQKPPLPAGDTWSDRVGQPAHLSVTSMERHGEM